MRLALWQTMPVLQDFENALSKLEETAVLAAQAKADLLITPEMFLSGYAIGADALENLAEPADGPSWARIGEIAKRHQIAVLAGGPRRDEDGRIFNTAQLRDDDGSLIASYDKTHLFGDVDRQQFQAGQCLSDVVLHKDWLLGFAICYDIEFPEVARALAEKGAEVILVPTANMEPFDSVAMRLVPARSEENGVYIAYANFCGADQAFTYNGLSCVTGPDGEDLARAGHGDELIFADLSKDHVKKTQSTVTYLKDRRADLYRDSSDHG